MVNYMRNELEEYYNGDEFLKSKDIDGNRPEIYISQSLRSLGKTTYYHNKLVKDYIECKSQFMILYRYINEIKGVSGRLQSITEEFIPGKRYSEQMFAGGSIAEIYDENEEAIGYACALSGYEKVKKNSNMFYHVDQMLFDEFLNEDNQYLPGEVDKLISIHVSVARAPGKPVRYVPVYMSSNKINIMNPYFIALGIIERLQPNTKKMRGEGWVLEIVHNQGLKQKLEESAFNRAFKKQAYMGYITDNNNKYVNEMVDVGKIKGDKRYVCTMVHGSAKYGVWWSEGIMYISKSCDTNYRRVIGVELADRILYPQPEEALVLQRAQFKRYFETGRMRFENGLAKQSFIQYLLNKC